MKKLFICLLAVLLIGCVSAGKKETSVSDLEKLAEGAKGKWSDYADQTAGNIADADTFLVRDVDDTTLAATGTQKEYPWSVMKTDLSTALDMGTTSPTTDTVTVSGTTGIYFNGDDDVIEFDLPADPTNKAYCFGNNAYANALTVDPDASDYITRDGVTAAQGEALVSTGNKKDWLCVVGVDTSNWRVTGEIGTWAEETPP